MCVSVTVLVHSPFSLFIQPLKWPKLLLTALGQKFIAFTGGFVQHVLLSSCRVLSSGAAAAASLQPSHISDVRGQCVRPVEPVTSTLWRDAEGSASNKAEEHGFLQREVKVIRFWRSFDRG